MPGRGSPVLPGGVQGPRLGPPPTWVLKRSAREGAAGSCRLSCGRLSASPGGSSRSADRPAQESFWLSGDDVCENRSWHCGGESHESGGRLVGPQAAGIRAQPRVGGIGEKPVSRPSSRGELVRKGRSWASGARLLQPESPDNWALQVGSPEHAGRRGGCRAGKRAPPSQRENCLPQLIAGPGDA